MKHSDSITEITTALTKMHVSYKKDTLNPFYKKKYASLNTILEAIREPLADNGLAVTQGSRPEGTNIVVETLVSHVSGEWITTETFIPVKEQDPQKAGASITYGRRYALEAFFNMSADDDDGNTASGKPTVKVNFGALEQGFKACQNQEEVTSLVNKHKANAGKLGWTPEQLDDVRIMGAKYYTSLADKVKDTFKGEEQ